MRPLLDIKKTFRLAAVAALLPACAFAQFKPTSPLPRPLMSHAAVLLDGRLYVAGGVSNSGPSYLSDLYYCADIAADGSLGAWRPGFKMPEMMGLGLHAMAAHAGRIYVIGGTNMFGSRNAVYSAAAQPDGSLSAWTTARALPYRLYAHAAAVYGGRLYVTGGIARTTGSTAQTLSAQINADGSLELWRSETPLPAPLHGHRSFARDGRLFVLGGASGFSPYSPGRLPPSPAYAGVYAAAVNPDGTLGPWLAQPPLPASMSLFGLAFSDKSAYLLGGYDGGISNAVYFAPFTPEGGLGAWVGLHPLPRSLVSGAAAVHGEYLYSIGGGEAYLDAPVADISFASLKTELKAFVRLSPSSINRKSSGKWVTVIFGLPEEDAAGIDAASLRISAVNEIPADLKADPKWTAKLYTGDSEDFSGLAGVKYLMTKFDRQALAKIIPEGEISIKVAGRLRDGRTFAGESVNRSFKSPKNFAVSVETRSGERSAPGGAKVFLPPGAFKGNADLLLSAAPEEPVTDAEKALRETSCAARGLGEVSAPFEFGPHGEVLEKPVKISLPYDPARLPPGFAESGLKLAWWNADKAAWELQRSEVDAEKKMVSAEVAHFSVYQVMAQVSQPAAAPATAVLSLTAAAATSAAITEAYVFPNPARGAEIPVLHLAIASAERASVRVYSSSGRLVYETAAAGAPGLIGGAAAYELPLRAEFTSGAYYYSAEIVSGSKNLRKTGKFAVVR